jgi:hypothetical protein
MVDSVDDVGVWRKEGIGFDFFEGLGDGFLAERTPDFLECVESRGGGILDEVDVREATLGKLTSAWFKIDSRNIFRSSGEWMLFKRAPGPDSDCG